ncbi:MAG TPA: hypothetical protein VHW91_07625 [Candidatus Dormibacteraeota bacterium]|jgi:hypothetical protein|nr:hypothetical protein [Candidatus Dormibacteraeota bacterium]
MRNRFIPFRLAPAAAIAAGLLVAVVVPASAHEVRTVGAYQFTVGWLHEPAYADEQNAVQFLLSDTRGNPVTDLGDTLKVEIVYQGLKMPAQALVPTFDPDTGLGRQGEYLASVIPTAPGNYTFHFTGSIKGQAVDQSFTSSDSTFDPVKEPTAVEFPAQDPTRGQISQKLNKLDPRLASVQTSAQNDAALARNLAIGAIVLGVLGTIGLIITLSRRPSIR